MPNQNKQEECEEGIRENIARIIFRCGYVSLENDAEREKLRNYIEPLFNFIKQTIHQEREKAVLEYKQAQLRQIKHIEANFERNGLVRETANKINEIIDVVNSLLPTNNTKEE